MDKGLIGGFLFGIFVILYSIWIAPGSSFKAFIDMPSMYIVFGGALAATCMAFPLRTVLQTPKVILKAFFPKPPEVGPVISQLVKFAEVARRDGILALENQASEISDPFILLGIQMAIDGTDAQLMETILRTEMEAVAGRHKTGKSIMDTLTKYAPAFGMIGTLVGLIIMLGNMDDPAAIGPGMAVALLTTLYGAALANMFCAPVADKLAYYSKREWEVREVVVRGILAIQDGDNPRVLEQKLSTFLSPAEKKSLAKNAA
ncbi:MAG: motility protein A [Planctomycetota bacterium]|nr:motility protein A [Planctomycetota bacterium]MDA1211088.1 motility protein A [Planctomycetota bacterium]